MELAIDLGWWRVIAAAAAGQYGGDREGQKRVWWELWHTADLAEEKIAAAYAERVT
ncbi:hypothetical protein [Pseudoduganella rivuli]|uniref:hypothetical protein n=1 Tax=Pseudoduganella rivuli TaxID=2666085 RepID=UPI001E5C9854|nr:hypothetical protein [Pseudoduganella rivuli]